MNVTTKEFKSYLEVQTSGKYNMFSQEAFVETGLDKETYLNVMKHYKELVEEYKNNEECKGLLKRLGY